jgi:hypothetical protein
LAWKSGGTLNGAQGRKGNGGLGDYENYFLDSMTAENIEFSYSVTNQVSDKK